MDIHDINRPIWEQGSDFHLFDYQAESDTKYPWDDKGLFMGSGRDAIRLLIKNGMQNRGWMRLWIPGYFCQEVVQVILASGIGVRVYDVDPYHGAVDWNCLPFQSGDVVLVINYFGLGFQPDYSGIDRNHIEIIEDHTHDPYSDWAWNSQADWVVASLRKTLPVSDGGVVWSPLGMPMPEQVEFTPERQKAAMEKFIAMVLKKYYLEGKPVPKQVFRELALSGEDKIASGEISAMSSWTKELLKTFPVASWREIRIRNYMSLVNALKKHSALKRIDELTDGKSPNCVPLLFANSSKRNHVRQKLIDNSIYPSILWELNHPLVKGIGAELIDLSERILCLHCDMRYTEKEMEFIGKNIINYVEE